MVQRDLCYTIGKAKFLPGGRYVLHPQRNLKILKTSPGAYHCAGLCTADFVRRGAADAAPLRYTRGCTFPLDALFTATSAVCVTGLVVVDTADTFSMFGQVVIAVLIQIGGLGVASIGMGLALVTGRRINLKGRSLVREALNVESLDGMVRLVRAVLLMTLDL